MKECTKCNRLLDEQEFSKNKNFKDGRQYCCKGCVSKYKKSDKYKEYEINLRKTPEYKKRHSDYEKLDKYKLTRKKYKQTEVCKESEKKYRQSNTVKLRMKENNKKFRKTEKRKEYEKLYSKTDIYRNIRLKYRKKRYYNDINYHLSHTFSSHIRLSLMSRKNGRKWESIVGYKLKDLMLHLEKRFDDKMSWENYGSYWHIDHIKPKSLFKFTSDKDVEFIECWSLKNLQPLEAKENLRKSNKYPYKI